MTEVSQPAIFYIDLELHIATTVNAVLQLKLQIPSQCQNALWLQLGLDFFQLSWAPAPHLGDPYCFHCKYQEDGRRAGWRGKGMQ